MGMRLLQIGTSREAARALDAAHLRSRFDGYEPCFATEGPRLLSRLEPPV